jgi:hypothetical protein
VAGAPTRGRQEIVSASLVLNVLYLARDRGSSLNGQDRVEAGISQRHSPTGASLLRMALSASGAMAKFLGSGLKTASSETVHQRLQMCSSCEQHTGLRCRVCGCFTKVKTRLLHEQCPMDKWPA